MYLLTDNQIRRHTLALRHAYKNHLAEEMKFHLLQSQIGKGIQDTLHCPECPETFSRYDEILEHFCVPHKKVQDSFWQLVHFETTFLTRALENPSASLKHEPNDQDQELNMFEHENTYKVSDAKKLMTIPMNTEKIQPLACCLMSEDLEHCHECWRVRIGEGSVGSVCQFEGFRKVKRVPPTDLRHQFAFEASGFLDPFKDPKPEDKELWTVPTKDVELNDAKMILLRAGDQFCNLAKSELDKIAEHKEKVGEEGENFYINFGVKILFIHSCIFRCDMETLTTQSPRNVRRLFNLPFQRPFHLHRVRHHCLYRLSRSPSQRQLALSRI